MKRLDHKHMASIWHGMPAKFQLVSRVSGASKLVLSSARLHCLEYLAYIINSVSQAGFKPSRARAVTPELNIARYQRARGPGMMIGMMDSDGQTCLHRASSPADIH